MRFRLRTKFLLSMLLILAGLTSTSLLLVRRRVEEQLRGQILQDLQNSVSTFQNLQRQRVLSLRHSAQLLANLPILRALMTTEHAATIQDASRDLWTLAGTDLFVLADRSGAIVGIHGTTPGFDRPMAQASMRQSLAQAGNGQWWFASNHLYEVSIQPIYFGAPAGNQVLGFLAVGYEIDDQVARELSQVAASQVAFWYGPNLVRSTLSRAQEAELVKHGGFGPAGAGSEPAEMKLGADPFLVTSIDLPPHTAAPVRLTVLKSVREANAVVNQLDRLVLGLGFLAVLAGSALVFFIARTFTRPLDNLVAGVRALAKGEYSYPLPVHGADEAAELTAAFSRMRTSLQQSQRKLLDAERLATIGRMASSISHDLRHQLAAILANAEFICEDRSDLERQELYQELQAAVVQMTDLIDSLLEFSRPRESLRLSYTHIDDVLERAIQTVRARPEFRTVEIRLHGEGMAGWFDSNKLQRVFQNLILNACEAVDPDGGRVDVSIRPRSETLEVAVADNGRGIPDEVRERIFEPFVSCGKENGTGLGLTVVQKIVLDHGGEVKVESPTAHGTVVVVSLPLLSSAQAGAPAATAQPTVARTEGSG